MKNFLFCITLIVASLLSAGSPIVQSSQAQTNLSSANLSLENLSSANETGISNNDSENRVVNAFNNLFGN
jgi:hypothetical protein